MSKGISDRKKAASDSFASMFDGHEERPSPEKVIVDVLWGKGNNEITDRQFEAAKILIPYRLPKLNTVEAHVATEDMTHEEWIAMLEGDDDE